MLTYEPGDTLGHRLDPRSKLAFQAGFGIAAFAHTEFVGLAALTALTMGVLATCRLDPREALGEFTAVIPFLVLAPVVQAIRVGPPWVDPAAAIPPALASYRTVLLLALGAAYVRTTPVAESQAAIQRIVPGKTGRFLGMGVSLVFRFLPLLQADIRTLRDASAARLGDQRPVRDRMRLLAVGALRRAFERADRLALALQARCFAWNPTQPALAFERADWPVLVAGVGLAALAFV